MYHSVFIGGNGKNALKGGRLLAGFRLRTAAKKQEYETFVIDHSTFLTQDELMLILENVISNETLMIGFSTIWLNYSRQDIHWANEDFFAKIRQKFPHVKLVSGSSIDTRGKISEFIFKNTDWTLLGFSDQSFPKLLDFLSGKEDHGLKFHTDPVTGKQIVESDRHHQMLNPDDLETVLEKEDGFLAHQPIGLEVSRGCIFRCGFCSHPFQGAKSYDSYQRTPESIARELKRNYDLFGTTRYAIMDDTFNDSMEKLDRLERGIELANLPHFEFVCYIKPELLVTKPEMIDRLKNLGLAGGYVGMESLNHESRTAVQKGMDVNRVMDSLKLLRQKTNAKLNASFIVGLPHDNILSQFKTLDFLKSSQKDLFSSWIFRALYLYPNGSSNLDKNFDKFGYRIVDGQWENNFMNFQKALSVSHFLNSKSETIKQAAGWNIATCWHLGISKDDIETKSVSQLNLEKRRCESERKSALELLSKFK